MQKNTENAFVQIVDLIRMIRRETEIAHGEQSAPRNHFSIELENARVPNPEIVRGLSDSTTSASSGYQDHVLGGLKWNSPALISALSLVWLYPKSFLRNEIYLKKSA